MNEELSKRVCEKILENHPVEKFRLIEMNFWHYLRLFSDTPPILNKPAADALHELMICVLSIYILQGRYDEAINYGKDAEKCSSIIDLPRTTSTI